MASSESEPGRGVRDHLATVATAPMPPRLSERVDRLCRALTQLATDGGNPHAVATVKGHYISHHEIRVTSLATVDASLVDKMGQCTRLHMTGACTQHAVYIDCVPNRVPEIVVELWEGEEVAVGRRKNLTSLVCFLGSSVYIVAHTATYYPFYAAVLASVV
jgi:hypothetical protein